MKTKPRTIAATCAARLALLLMLNGLSPSAVRNDLNQA